MQVYTFMIPYSKRVDYYPDHERKVLWILVRKCASSTMRHLIGLRTPVFDTEAYKYKDYLTIGMIRHPWDRVVSTLFSVLRDGQSFPERAAQNIEGKHPLHINSHVRPCTAMFEGFRMDWLIRVDKIEEGLAKLPFELGHVIHANEGKYRPPDWRSVDYDWNRIKDIYKGDFALCDEWQTS